MPSATNSLISQLFPSHKPISVPKQFYANELQQIKRISTMKTPWASNTPHTQDFSSFAVRKFIFIWFGKNIATISINTSNAF